MNVMLVENGMKVNNINLKELPKDILTIWKEYGNEAYMYMLVDSHDAYWKIDYTNWINCPSNIFVDKHINNNPKYFTTKSLYYG